MEWVLFSKSLNVSKDNAEETLHESQAKTKLNISKESVYVLYRRKNHRLRQLFNEIHVFRGRFVWLNFVAWKVQSGTTKFLGQLSSVFEFFFNNRLKSLGNVFSFLFRCCFICYDIKMREQHFSLVSMVGNIALF